MRAHLASGFEHALRGARLGALHFRRFELVDPRALAAFLNADVVEVRTTLCVAACANPARR
jgi:hypothetical protein